jgi:sensor histidine kinase YesM
VTARQWLLVSILWTSFALITAFQVWLSMITHGHSGPRLVGYYIAIWAAWILITHLIVRLIRIWPVIPARRVNLLIHLLAACAIAVLHSGYWMILTITIRPFDRLTVPADKMDIPGHFLSRLVPGILLYSLVAGAAQAAEYYEKYRQRELALTNARLHALERQIQPHFLFNTLNAVSALTRAGRSAEAISMISGLSDLLRYTLDHAENQCVTLAEEAAMVERYLDIQRTRFADRLTYSIDVPAEVSKARVPTFILQPLAENAIRHGIARSAAAGCVSVTATRANGEVRIEVFNTGSLGESGGSGIGVRNTRERLRNLYGDAERFTLRQTGAGVVATLSIPLESDG